MRPDEHLLPRSEPGGCLRDQHDLTPTPTLPPAGGGGWSPAAAAALALALAACSDPPPPDRPAPTGTATLTVELYGFRNDVGKALVGLYVGPRGFPEDRSAAVEGKEAPIVDRRASVRFDDVPATAVALAALHDEDGDTRMKKGFFGQPKEGYGFSRDAPVRFGPPDFEDAAIQLANGDHKTVRIKIRY